MTENKVINEKHWETQTETCKEVQQETGFISTNWSGTRTLDGTTSWFVCVSVLSASSIAYGSMLLYGIFFPFILKEFKESKSRTALVASIVMGVHMLASPIASKICLTVGCRVTIVLAGFIGAGGLLTSSFAPNLYVLCVGYGLALGFSVSLVYNASFQIIPLYFDKHRFLALGMIAVCPGAGTLIMNPIAQAILDHINWRKTMMALAGINFVQCFLGCSITRKQTIPAAKKSIYETPTYLPMGRRLWTRLKLLDFSFFKDLNFMIIAISFAIAILGDYTPYFHLAQYSAELGIPGERSTWIYLGIGTGSMVFRILTGKLLDMEHISPLRLCQLSTTLFGIANFLVPLTKSFSLLMVYALVNGICDGIFVTVILSMIIRSYPGMGLGWALCFQGVSLLICPVLAGFISDVSGSYHPVFYTAGGIHLLSVCLIQTTQWIKHTIDEEKQLKNNQEELMIVAEKETVC